MPYPSQVNTEIIVNTAWEMIEAEGVEQLSLGKLAEQLGVKAPSLYRHVGSKAGLMQAVNLLTAQRLITALNEAAATSAGNPEHQLTAVFNAYRNFAHENPNNYICAMTNNNDDYRPDENVVEQMVLPVQAIMEELTGEENSLAALRGALALIHGFVLLELNQQLRRGGSLDEAFQAATRAYLRGWQT